MSDGAGIRARTVGGKRVQTEGLKQLDESSGWMFEVGGGPTGADSA